MQFFINSLKRRPERAYSRLGALEAQGFPMDRVHVVWGKYWGDFPDFETLCDNAVEDFPEIEGIRKARRIGYVAAMWSFFRTYRAIQNENIELSMVFEDDFLFKLDYKSQIDIYDNMPDDLKIGILSYHKKPKDDTSGKYRDLTPVNDYWGRGVVNSHSSHNVANIYTPEGIQMIRDRAAETDRLNTIENMIGRFHDTEGVYSLLRPIVRASVLQGKSDAMAGSGTERESSIENVERWKTGYNVGVENEKT